jgi:hypothetical protein
MVLPADWWMPSVAGIMLVSRVYPSCGGCAAFGKVAIGGISSSSLALASRGEVASRLLAQLALLSKSVFLA